MDISLDDNIGKFRIRSYSPGQITVNDKHYEQPLVMSLNHLETEGLPSSALDITEKLLERLEVVKYEAILLGTGETLEQLSWDIIEKAQLMGAPLEIMSTAAACRTFTVLASEGRQVLAILYP